MCIGAFRGVSDRKSVIDYCDCVHMRLSYPCVQYENKTGIHIELRGLAISICYLILYLIDKTFLTISLDFDLTTFFDHILTQ